MEVISTINSAEAEARKIKSDAERSALSAREKAVEEGRTAAEAAKSAARAEVAGLIKAALVSAQKSAESLARTTENKKAVLRDRVTKKLESAANYIVESVVNG